MEITTEGSQVGKKAIKVKRSSKKKGNKNRYIILALAIFGITALLIGGVFAYKTIRYNSAPEEIKLIRTLPIYNYESDDLKIVSRSEDYGGTDWKGVYNTPSVYVSFGFEDNVEMYKKCSTKLTEFLNKNSWARGDDIETLDGQDSAYSFSKVINGRNVTLSLWPSQFENESCYVSISTK